MLINSVIFVLIFVQILPTHQIVKTHDELRNTNKIEIPNNIKEKISSIFDNEANSTEASIVLAKQKNHEDPLQKLFSKILLDEDLVSYLENIVVPQKFCPKRDLKCDPNFAYRSIDGSCNNLEHPWWGKSDSIYTRFLKPSYQDKHGSPRVGGRNGSPLPNERHVSLKLVKSFDTESKSTILSLSHGQFLTHDVSKALYIKGIDGKKKDCLCETNDKECFNIPTPFGDVLNYDQKCMSFPRSAGVSLDLDCNLRIREQINEVTHFIDLSVVYGSDEKTASLLRKFKGGLLRTSKVKGSKLEQLAKRNNTKCPYSNDRSEKCFLTGDSRAEETLMTLSLHALWLREHNRIARKLAKINPYWCDETLYQEARRITIAEYQHITSNEYLPLILGEKLASEYGLLPTKEGYFLDYDKNIFSAVLNEFASAAFRIYHTMVNDEHARANNKFRLYDYQNVSTFQFNTVKYAINAPLEDVLYGTCAKPSYLKETQINKDLKNHLFECIYKNQNTKRYDLFSINVHRGRDHGLPGYNFYREACGLNRAIDFDDLKCNMDEHIIERLRKLYRHVDDIDLYAGIVAENAYNGLSNGHTSACIIAKQFNLLKYGDRFWYENGHDPNTKFNLDQLKQIKEVKMARILCDNTNLEFVQQYPFLLHDSELNPYMDCKHVPKVNLKPWDNVAKKSPLNKAKNY